MFGRTGSPQSSQSTATGSGFVIDAQGHIVTAGHVVQGANSITVAFQDGTIRTATVVGTDNATDVALLKVDPSGLTLHPLTLGRSSSIDVGDAVAAIGDPFGYARSISTGIVSGVEPGGLLLKPRSGAELTPRQCCRRLFEVLFDERTDPRRRPLRFLPLGDGSMNDVGGAGLRLELADLSDQLQSFVQPAAVDRLASGGDQCFGSALQRPAEFQDHVTR